MIKNKKAPTFPPERLRGYKIGCCITITNSNVKDNGVYGYALPITYKAVSL